MAEAPTARRAKLPLPETTDQETKQRARKEESYLEDEYLRARRKNLRSPWPAAAIEGIGAGEQRRLSQRKDTGRSALPGAAAARWPPSASHLTGIFEMMIYLRFFCGGKSFARKVIIAAKSH